MALPYVLLILLGYFLGCINPAYIISRLKGVDIKSIGSGNAGASNAAWAMGIPVGLFVAFFDVAKAVISVLLARRLFPDVPHAVYVAGTSTILGHIFPFYMGFRGGKGFASLLGLMLVTDWRFFLAFILAGSVITLVTDFVSFATLTAAITYPLYLWLMLDQLTPAMMVSVVSLVMIVKHIDNLKRIWRKQEVGLRQGLGVGADRTDPR